MDKFNVNFDQPELTGKEIASMQNFEEVLSGVKAVSASLSQAWWFAGISTLAIVTAIIVGNNVIQPEKNIPFVTKSEDQPVEDIHRSILRPPVPEADRPFELYHINADDENALDYISGSSFTIPKNAFVDKNGNPVSGKITVKYREFHDPLDIWLSGIPMEYDSSGTHLFESAGMLELRAFKDGEELALAPGKEIDMHMTSYDDRRTFNVYHLNDKTGDWTYMGKDKVTSIAEDAESPYSSVDPIQEHPEITRVEEALIELEKVKPVAPVKYDASKYTLDLDVNTDDFPYLKNFTNVKFEVADQQNFDTGIYNIEWSDAKIDELISGKRYVIHLTSKRRNESIEVVPVLKGKDLRKAYQDYEASLSKWRNKKEEKRLRIEEMNRQYQEKLDRYNAEYEAEQLKNIDTLERAEKMDQQFDALRSVLRQSNPAIRNFPIISTGIVNCDQFKERYPKGRKKPAAFVNKKAGKFFIPFVVYLIEKGKNMIYSFDKDRYSTKFSYNPNANSVMWTVTKEGYIAVFTEEDFKNYEETDKDQYTFRMRIADNILKTKEEIAEFLGLKKKDKDSDEGEDRQVPMFQ